MLRTGITANSVKRSAHFTYDVQHDDTGRHSLARYCERFSRAKWDGNSAGISKSNFMGPLL